MDLSPAAEQHAEGAAGAAVKPRLLHPSNLIDAMGGTGAVARECQVSSQAVTQWRRHGIPSARLMYLRVRFPQLFGDEMAAHAA